MFIVLASQFELIFCLLTLPKCNLRKIKKSFDSKNLKFDLWHFPSDLEIWPLTFDFETLTQNITLNQLKLWLNRRRWSDDYTSRIETLNSFSASWLTLIANWKRCFKCSQSTWNSYFDTCAAQNASSIKSRKRCFKSSQAMPSILLPLYRPKMWLA